MISSAIYLTLVGDHKLQCHSDDKNTVKHCVVIIFVQFIVMGQFKMQRMNN